MGVLSPEPGPPVTTVAVDASLCLPCPRLVPFQIPLKSGGACHSSIPLCFRQLLKNPMNSTHTAKKQDTRSLHWTPHLLQRPPGAPDDPPGDPPDSGSTPASCQYQSLGAASNGGPRAPTGSAKAASSSRYLAPSRSRRQSGLCRRPGLRDQIRRYYISLFTCPPAAVPRGTREAGFSLSLRSQRP